MSIKVERKDKQQAQPQQRQNPHYSAPVATAADDDDTIPF